MSDLTTQISHLSRRGFALLIDDARVGKRVYMVGPTNPISLETVAKMADSARGILWAAVDEARLKELRLPLMPSRMGADPALEMSVSVEARHGVTTGISASDRATTLNTLATTKESLFDLVTPGHIFPVRSRAGGVLIRSGVAEAAADLCSAIGSPRVAAVCECLTEQGDHLSEKQAPTLAADLDAPLITITQLIRHRLSHENLVEHVASAQLPTIHAGVFTSHCFRSKLDGAEHLVLVKGDMRKPDEKGFGTIEPNSAEPLLVRVQAEDRLGDLFGMQPLPGRARMLGALKYIDQAGRGIFVYIRHPRRGTLSTQTNLLSETLALDKDKKDNSKVGSRQNKAEIGLSQEIRELGIGAQILKALGVKRIRILSNSAKKIVGAEAFGLSIEGYEKFEPFLQ